jgi:DNA excision repair protein ERCC-2
MDAARGVMRLRSALDRAGEETMVLWRTGRSSRTRRPPPRRHQGQLSLLSGPAMHGGVAGPDTGLKLLCRDPSRLLGAVFKDLAGAICMSATLRPADFYERLLGLPPKRIRRVGQPSPFPPENRRVVVLPDVSTEYRRRDRDRAETARLVSETVRAVPGNVAVFFPSFAFRDRIAPLLDLGERPVLVQERAMPESARTELLDTLRRAEGHALLGVLGGIFSEGVDLPGDALLAAVVVGPSLPQANLERRLLQQWFEERYDEGFRYAWLAWLVPGLSRVVQAAGRVIRSPEDRGAVVLVGRRFVQRDYAAFFPDDWTPVRSRDPAAALAGLWGPAVESPLKTSETPKA